MKNKIYKEYKKELLEKIKMKFKNHHHNEILKNILNNSKDEKIIKFKKIKDKRKKTKRKKKNKNKQNNKIYICKICSENLNVSIDHFKSKEHINNFNKNIEISTKKYIEEKFIDIIFKFKINTKDAFLKDLYFKEVAKQKVEKT